MSLKSWLPTERTIDLYKLHKKMLQTLAIEVRELSRKKQEGTLNLTKVKMLNRVLKPLKEEVLGEVPASIFLDLLDEAALPNNSDAVLIISQYETALNEFQEEYWRVVNTRDYGRLTFWATTANPDGLTDADKQYTTLS